MKRIFFGVIFLLLLLSAAAYIFIPGRLAPSSGASFNANREGVYRFLINERNWQKWWPGTISKDSNGTFLFRYKGFDFSFDRILYNVIHLRFGENNDNSYCLLNIFPFAVDSIGIELSTELNSGMDPFSRISTYIQAEKVKQVFHDIVWSLQNYSNNLENIYGIAVKKEKVQYQYVVSKKQTFTHYPTTEDVYSLVGELRNYVSRSGAKELFWPMLNIETTERTYYVAQVGIPVDRRLPQQGNITVKWMMKGGNILSGEVIGGQQKIDEATKQMEMYIRDYQRAIIAIPFQMLITDRTKEPDSTKWVTRIYYPVV